MNLTMKSQMPVLAILDSHGRYIPQLWCSDLDENQAKAIGVNWDDVKVCKWGPDHEWYWEAWESILNCASMTDKNGTKWILYQDGDLWEIPEGFDFDREESYYKDSQALGF